MPSKLKVEPVFQGGFIFGFIGTFVMTDPYFPLALRLGLIPILLAGTASGITQIWYRYVGIRMFKGGSKWGEALDGIGGGTTTTILILVIYAFFYHVPIAIPSLSL